MEHADILQLVGKYKFALAFENAVCRDYITEKFWRPLKVGTVPIVYGSDRFQVEYLRVPSCTIRCFHRIGSLFVLGFSSR
jgi:hypothetical protein